MKSAMQYRKFIDEPTMSDKTLLVSVEDLINTAFGTVEQNIVNFKLVQTVMHILARQMRMLEQDVEIKIDELADRPRRTYDQREEYDDDQPYASASTESRDQIAAGEDGRGGGPRTERPGERSERGGGGREDDRTDDGTRDTTSGQGADRGADAAEIDGSRGGGPQGRKEGGGAGRDDGGGRDDARSGGGGTGGGGAGGVGAGGAGAGGGVGAGGGGAGGVGAGGGGAGGGGGGGGVATVGGGGAGGGGGGGAGAGGGAAVVGGGGGGRGGGGGGGGGGTAAGGGGGGREDAKSKDRGGQKAAGGGAGGGKKRAVSTDKGRKGTPDTGRSTATSAGRSSGRGSRTSITVTESTRKGGTGAPKDKILVVEKGPTTRGGGVARVGSIEVVTASQFALLEKAVRELENVAGPLPMPALPDNERLRQDLAQGRASLSETMQAMQLTARIQAAEDGLTRMAELLTQLAAAGALPQEMAGQIGQVRDQLQQAVTAVADAVGQAGGTYPGGPGMGPGGVGPGSASVGVGPQAVGGVAQGYGGPGMGPGGVGPAGVATGMGPGAVGPGMAPGAVGPGMGPGAVGPGMAPGGVGPGMGPDAVGPGMGPGGVGPGMVQGGVGPGMGPGGVGPGMGPGGVGPGMAPDGVGPGMGPGGVGPGTGPGGVGPGMAQGGVGPGMAQGGVGPGMAQGGVGPGMAQGGVGPGMAQGGVGPGMAQGGVGPGMAQGGVGPGMAQGGVGPGMAQGGMGPGMAQGGMGPGMGPGGVGPAMGPGGVGPGMGPGGVGPGMGPGGMQQGYGGQGMGPGGVGPGMGPGGVGPGMGPGGVGPGMGPGGMGQGYGGQGMGPGGVGPGMGPGGMGQGYGGQGMGPGGVGPGMGPGGMDQGYGGQGMGPGGGGPGGVGQGMGPGGVGPGMGPGGVGPGMRPGSGGPGGKRGGTGAGTSSTPGGMGAESYGPSGPPGRKSVAIDKTSSHPDSMRRGDGSGGTSRASMAAGARRPSEIAAASGLGTGGVGNVTHPEMESVLLIMRSELIKEITALTTRATHSADIASNTSKAVADKLDVALNIDNRITKLFSLAKDYAEQLSGFDSGLATQMASFQEQMAQMRLDLKGGIQQLEQANNNAETAAILELTERYEGLVIELDNTLHTHQSLTVLQKQLSEELRSLVECVEMLREQKADRDEVLDGLRDKADITRLAGLLHEGDFAHAREDLEERLENCYKKFKRQDEIWLCALKDLAAITESKAEIIQLLAIKDTATDELKKIQESLRQLYIMLGEPKAAILMRMLAKGAACGSCLAPALMEPTDPDFGQPNALPALRPPPDGEEPCTVMLKPLPPPDARHHVCRRWVGGSHTLVGAPVTRERAVADTRAPPTKRFAGYGTDGRMYLLEEELQPCVECNKLSTDDQDEGPLPTPTGGGGDQGGGATPFEEQDKDKK